MKIYTEATLRQKHQESRKRKKRNQSLQGVLWISHIFDPLETLFVATAWSRSYQDQIVEEETKVWKESKSKTSWSSSKCKQYVFTDLIVSREKFSPGQQASLLKLLLPVHTTSNRKQDRTKTSHLGEAVIREYLNSEPSHINSAITALGCSQELFW